MKQDPEMIFNLGFQLYMVSEVADIDEAQALLDSLRSQGHVAACTHRNEKHQVFADVEPRKEKR